MQSIEQLSLRALSRALAGGELTAVELVEHCLDRVERLDERLHAWVAVYADDARNAAHGADLLRRAGHAVGPLAGIPVGIKDIIDIEGRITTGGSRVWSERVSPVTATLVRHLVRAGMIVLGKTHSVEFAMGGWGTNNAMGTPRNPWDTEHHRAPGGSSSGSGVAVAAGMVPCAIGTDTGGSVRLPSAWNGLTGLKTTVGTVSCEGVLPLAPTLDTPGPLARTAEDAALLFRILGGDTAAGWATLGTPASRLDGRRLAVPGDDERALADEDMNAALDAAVEVLRDLGATVETVDLGHGMNAMGTMLGHIIGIEGYSFVGKLVDDPTLPVDDDVRPRIQIGRGRTAEEYLHILREREHVKAAVAERTRGFDAVLTPAVTGVAPNVASIDQSSTPAVFTRFVNLLDWCALVVPCGHGSGGLPLSLQIACPGHAEHRALEIGMAFQAATDWHCARAPV